MKTFGLKEVAASLRPVPDFPIEGILFWDIEPVLREPEAVRTITQAFAHHWAESRIDAIAGFDARGFLFGVALAQCLNLPFVQIRKKGKLPGKTLSQSYSLEYGEAEIEMIDDGFIDGKRILMVDDLLATGGTALAGAQLIERLGGVVVGLTCVTELPELAGRQKLLHYPVYSLVSAIGGQLHVGVEYCVDIKAKDLQGADKFLLIRRLNEPEGYAMPGGRIEPHESILDAAARELIEETGCIGGDFTFLCVLTDPSRDPRGVKVSYVLETSVQCENAMGEVGKTDIAIYAHGELPLAQMVLGHEAVF